MSEFQDVFPNELPGLPLEREIDFTIELKPGAEPISKTPYQMTAPELCELQMQLKELLDLGLIRPSVDNCIVDLGVCTTRLKVYVTALGTYDLIIGMDWLASHRDLVDCFTKRVFCVDDEGRPIEI